MRRKFAKIFSVSAANTTYKLEDLLKEGKIKALGRTKVSDKHDGITADWSANGFEININSAGGYFQVGYESSLAKVYSAILVDGEQVWRGLTTGVGTAKVMLTPGKHRVSVIRENGHSSKQVYLVYTTVAFEGTIEARPADKSLYIEVVGDSLACGAGSVRDYAPGVQWGDLDSSGQASFGWYISEMLNADLSIVARGGIGLIGEIEGALEKVTTKEAMLDIYPYASGHNKTEGFHDYASARKADLVVIEVGGNDALTVADPDKTARWDRCMAEMIRLVRKHHGETVKIVLMNLSVVGIDRIIEIADKDPYIYACHFELFGNGTAALKSQKEGHPNADDEYAVAERLYKIIQDNDIFPEAAKAAPVYEDVCYYVSENGSDANDGTTLDTALKTFTAAMTRADAADLPDGSRVVIYLNGTVLNQELSVNSDKLGGSQVKSATGRRLPVLVTTYNYTAGGTKAILDTAHSPVADGNAFMTVYNDITFRGIAIQGTARTNGESTCRDRSLYGGFCDVVFDDVRFIQAGADTEITDAANLGGWRISAGRAGNVTVPETDTDCSITFRNGDYTNLDLATAVLPNKYTGNVPHGTNVTQRLVIGDGARMGAVYGAYGKLQVKEAVVELRGGSVEEYHGTRSGTDYESLTYKTNITTIFDGDFAFPNLIHGTGDYVTVNGNVTTRFLGGKVRLEGFFGTGNNVTIHGNVTNDFTKGQFVGRVYAGSGKYATVSNVINRISGGELRVNPESTDSSDGIFLGGYGGAGITGNVENHISGGDVNLLYNTNANSGIYLGMYDGTIHGDLINDITGGNLYCGQYAKTISSVGIYFANCSGDIEGALKNHIAGGAFRFSTYMVNTSDGAIASTGTVNLGNRTPNNFIGRIENVFGVKDSLQGPRFYTSVCSGGAWAWVGRRLAKPSGSDPVVDPAFTTDEVVIRNIIYSGYFNGCFMGSMKNDPQYDCRGMNYVVGSVQTDIYGGTIADSVYGCGTGDIAGHVTTNIYGGKLCGIHGAYGARVYDGVELNIVNMTDMSTVYKKSTVNGKRVFFLPDYKIYAGGTTAEISAQTPGRDAVKLTIAPEAGKQLRLYSGIFSGCSSGSITGSTHISISGGIYPNGFKVDGKPVAQVVASGYSAVNHITGETIRYGETDTELAGCVEIVPQGQSTSRELAYYVRPYGSDSDDGRTFIKAKLTVNAAILQAVEDNGGSAVFPDGSKLTIYVDGTVNAGGIQSMLYDGKLLTTADGKHMETVIETYKYSDTRATIVHNYTEAGTASSSYLTTDLTLKNVNIMSKGGGDGQTTKLFTAGCNLAFDNADLITNNGLKWTVSADPFNNGNLAANYVKP